MKIKLLTLLSISALILPATLRAEITTASAGVHVPERKVRTIAVVNNEPIFSDEFDHEAEPFIERYKQTAPAEDQTEEKFAKLKKDILDRLIEEKLILQQAKNLKLKVNKAEIDRGIEQFKEPFTTDAKGQARPAAEAEKAFQAQLVKEGMSNDQFVKRVEEQLIKMKLIEQNVRSKVVLPKDEDGKKLHEKIRKRINNQTIEGASKEELTDLDQMAKYFKRIGGEQVHIRHILIRFAQNASPMEKMDAKKKTEDLLARIKKGEDFSILAAKNSQDPVSRERGGDIGFVAKGDLGLPTLEDFAFKAKEGDVSAVIESEVGYHIVKVVEKKASHQVEYEDVAEDLKGYLAQKNFAQKLEAYLKDLREKASIKINE